MGVEKIRRPLLAPQGLQIEQNSTFTADVVLSTAGSTDAGIRQVVQTIAPSGASGVSATAVTNRGVTVINSTGTGAGWVFNLTAPAAAGMEKIVAINPASTVPVQVRTASSAGTFFGSTANAFEASTAGTSGNLIGKGKVVTLLSISTSQWAVKSFFPQNTTGTTFLTLLGATA